MTIYKYNQLTEKTKYHNNTENCSNHYGQLKLLMSEIHFLSKYYKDGMTILYIGAAEGYHIKKLTELFPTAKFDLWDPGKFVIKNSKNIKIFNKFFLDKHTKLYKKNGKKILFISDIRNIPREKTTYEKYKKMNEHIIEDMKNQLKWVQIIKPAAISLKFRLSYKDKMEYIVGDIWLQSYSPGSTEMRLFADSKYNYTKYIEYDGVDIDEKLAYFNTVIRCEKCSEWDKIMKKYKIKNNWDNCYALNIFAYYLKTQNKTVNQINAIKLFINTIIFLKERYGKKYLNLFIQ